MFTEYASKGVLKSPFKRRCVTRLGAPILKASEFGDSDLPSSLEELETVEQGLMCFRKIVF